MKEKIHLGCGQRYIEGYWNVDFPLSEHSSQIETVADVHADILTLCYPSSTIKEVRLHHVFEHFDRVTAAALICRWNSWLTENGTLRIEVPDVARTAWLLIFPFFGTRQQVAVRHMFGSHEARWAVHAEGYTRKTLIEFVEAFGFKKQSMSGNYWKGTFNVDATFVKVSSLDENRCVAAARNLFERYLLDQSDGEMRILDYWLEKFKADLIVQAR